MGHAPFAATVSVLLCALAAVSCGDYDPEPSPATGGSATTSTGQLGSGGTAAVTGSAGSAGMSAAASPSQAGTGGGSAVTPVQASCTGVTPCGGDVVGTWVAAGSCLPVSGEANMSGFGLGCTAAPVVGRLEVSGALTANADGSFTDTTTTSGESQIELPASCLNVSGTVTSCDRLDGALQALGYSTVTCADAAGGGCSCTATVQQAGGMGFVVLGAQAGGTYTATDDVFAVQGRSPREYAYCVSGSTLTMTPRGMSTTGALTGTIVLQKQ